MASRLLDHLSKATAVEDNSLVIMEKLGGLGARLDSQQAKLEAIKAEVRPALMAQ